MHPEDMLASVPPASAMRDMSKAIRQELESHGPTLADIPTGTLIEITTIVSAYYLDLRAEVERREIPL